MARSWLVTTRGIAKKIRNAADASNSSELFSDANRECPNCKHIIDNSDVALEWPGLPAGVKFDPTDLQLIEHLQGKIGIGNSVSHMFIDEFIPTLDSNEGICYTHPENLPGAKKDGTSIHFFHRITNAYASGQRKRRRISNESLEHVRWHKTGKTKSIWENGVQKGWKKIMVLYKSSSRFSKPDKANWVMHQYHLGMEEDEKDGDLVVSKVLYQAHVKNTGKEKIQTDTDEGCDASTSAFGPKTPKTNIPPPPRETSTTCDTPGQIAQPLQKQDEEPSSPIISLDDREVNPSWLAGESRSVELIQKDLEKALQCHEPSLDAIPFDAPLPFDYPSFGCSQNGALDKVATASYVTDLDNFLLSTPPDFMDLPWGSQESFGTWLDRM